MLPREGDLYRVPEDAPWFAGHFPKRAVLPGIVQIGAVLAALRERRGRPVALRGVRHLRLRATVHPGDLLALDLQDGSPVRFTLARGGEVVSRGVLDVA